MQREGRKNSKRDNVSCSEKRKLASLVKTKPELWDGNNPLHRCSKTHTEAWEEISSKMGILPEKCKAVWKSLQDGYRYRRKIGENMTDRGEINDPMEYISSNYIFAKDLAFLVKSKKPKEYITYIKDGAVCDDGDQENDSTQHSFYLKRENSIESDPIDTDTASSMKKQRLLSTVESVYSDNDTPEITRKDGESVQNPIEPSANRDPANLVTQLGKLVEAQTEFIREFKSHNSENITYKIQLTAVDALLQQLPKNIAEKTLIEMQNYVLKKVNEFQQNKSDSEY